MSDLADIGKKMEDAKTNAGDMEVMDCMFLKARALAAMGSFSASDVAYDEIVKKEKTSTGKKIDATMEKTKNALFSMVRQLGIFLTLIESHE